MKKKEKMFNMNDYIYTLNNNGQWNKKRFFIGCLHMFCRWEIQILREVWWGPINWLSPVTRVCLSQTRSWISTVICRFLWYSSERWLFVLLKLIEQLTIWIFFSYVETAVLRKCLGLNFTGTVSIDCNTIPL